MAEPRRVLRSFSGFGLILLPEGISSKNHGRLSFASGCIFLCCLQSCKREYLLVKAAAMRKCPDCTEENINESLFCQHCGRCLLTPEPEMVQLATATHTEPDETPEGIDSDDRPIAKKPLVYSLKRKHQTRPAVTQGWLLVTNSLVLILMFEIVRYMVSR